MLIRAESYLAVLELCIRAAGPVNWRVLDFFGKDARVADAAQVRLLGGRAHWSNLNQFFEDAKLSPVRLHFGQA